VLLCCCCMTMCSVGCGVNCAGLFYQPIAEEFRTGIGSVSLYQTLLCLNCGFFGPLAVRCCRKYDIRLVLFLSGALSVGCFVAMANITAVWQLYFWAVFLGASIAFYGMVTVTLVIGNWFHALLGTAVGIAQSCSGIGGAVLNPALSLVMARWGWRGTYFTMALLIALFLAPGVILLRNTPQDLGMEPYGGTQAAQQVSKGQPTQTDERRGGRDLILICLIGFVCACCSSMGTHLSGYANAGAFPAQLGVFMISVAMVGNFSGKFLLGLMADRLGARKSILIINFTALCGFCILTFPVFRGWVMMIMASVLLGATYSLHGVGLSMVAKERFHPDVFAHKYALSQVSTSVGSALSYAAIGYSYDIFGTYKVATVVGMVFLLMAAVATQVIYRPESRSL